MAAPAAAIREFTQTLMDPRIAAAASHVRADIADLRRAFPADDDFAAALRAVSLRLRTLHIVAGAGLVVDRADLRIIYRFNSAGIELRAFGHRSDPESVYLRAAKR